MPRADMGFIFQGFCYYDYEVTVVFTVGNSCKINSRASTIYKYILRNQIRLIPTRDLGIWTSDQTPPSS